MPKDERVPAGELGDYRLRVHAGESNLQRREWLLRVQHLAAVAARPTRRNVWCRSGTRI